MDKVPRPKRTSAKKAAPAAATHAWELEAEFQEHAFEWRPQPAVVAVKRAVAEIKKVAKKDPVLGAEGALSFLERASPALAHVDSSSGAIGTAVSRAIEEIAPVLASAPVDAGTRAAWLERLYAAYEADRIPCIESLADHWGELCASTEVASAWADRLLADTRQALSPEREGYFRGIPACLSALHRAGRFDELLDVLRVDTIWQWKQWAVRALVSAGRKAEAIAYAEACRSPWARDTMIDQVCEAILLSSGMADEAYTRYGLHANHAATYLATFRAITEKYPHKAAADVLADLAKTTPGDEGKWFAAAKHAALYEEALALAARSYCDPKTLARAARDHAETHAAFAVGAGLLALRWLANGRFDITEAEVQDAYRVTMSAAEHAGSVAETTERVRALLDSDAFATKFMKAALARELRG